MKHIIFLLSIVLSARLLATPSITGVSVRSQEPWNGKVDISYTVKGDISAYCREYGLIPSLKVTAIDRTKDIAYTAATLSGDASLAQGSHKVEWNLAADGLMRSADIVFSVACDTVEAQYCVIDLSAGSNAASYPIIYLADEPQGGFNVDEYKTIKLVLKRIKSGSFIMGEDQTDESHKVTLTRPFYMGVFEITQKQWTLVMGSNPAKSYGVGDAYPVYYVSYDMIRGSSDGAKWPLSDKVDASSFMGKLQARTGLNFDLPTDAQWEYSCRAGTTTSYYWGSSMNGDYAWYASNSGSVAHFVGGRRPNDWGLHDMSGNVWEWCLDVFCGLEYGVDPKGAPAGVSRVIRGGSWGNGDSRQMPWFRGEYDPFRVINHNGFRLSRTLPSRNNYCIVDVSAGPEAESYLVTYMDDEPEGGFNTDEYKTNKIVLKKIDTGSFIMGEDQTDASRTVYLTKPYYIGLFELTQKQWSLVMGSDPCETSEKGIGDTFPVHDVSYDMIRGSEDGSKWPESEFVDETSFMGKLRSKAGLSFDLPTEAQWEYACRAGTTTLNSYGDLSVDEFMWHLNNSESHTHEVGLKMANPWGLYDVHGNVWEWCLDWFGALSYGSNPVGLATGTERVRKGMAYYSNAIKVSSSGRMGYDPSSPNPGFGLRLAENAVLEDIVAEVGIQESSIITIVGNPEDPVITPESGTTFDASLSVSMSCASEGATIHYTTDGSEPTMESPVYKRFRVYGKTTVKARAFYENGSASEIMTAEYALGRCPEPVVVSAGGETFYHSGNVVTIEAARESASSTVAPDQVVRYTVDGSEPTAESPIYTEPFAIDASTVVKAKAFSDSFFDSAVVTAELTRAWEAVATPVITAADSFSGSKTTVSIACATDGALVRYTTDGSEPGAEAATYSDPFEVTASTVVKAYAVLADYTNSDVATKTITKVWCIGDSLGAPDQVFETSGDADWVRDTEVSHDGSDSMRSGKIVDGQVSVLSTKVTGKGTVCFFWKASTEDSEGVFDWDHGEFHADDSVYYIEASSGWEQVTHTFATDGEHTLTWKYVKDAEVSEGKDCIWVDTFSWSVGPTVEATQTTEVPVPFAWLKAKYPELTDAASCEAKANEVAANGVNTVWECYVIGLEPTAAEARFVASIEMVDGVPKVTWSPDLGAERVYRVLGARGLGSAAFGCVASLGCSGETHRGTGLGDAAAETARGTVWKVVTEETKGDYRFFKVAVEMP